jgi:cellulose synthase/poly-beta-1,6-N-acetylglucosamine synthase-like glycosyltransferase
MFKITESKALRLLEILPGLAIWTALVLPIFLSFIAPVAVGVFILIFDLYWIYKALVMSFHLVSGYRALSRNIKVDWMSKLKAVTPTEVIPNYKDIYHAIILVTYQEDIAILRESIKSVVDAEYDKDRIIFVLATEERDKERARKYGAELKKEFGSQMAHFLVTEHPDGIAGERKAKGANATWAASRLSEYVAKEKINPGNIIVSIADSDSIFHPRYFAALAYAYIINPNRLHRSYQPIPIFANNIWDAPAIARILAFGSTFWQMIESTRPWRLINFSTHAMSLATLQAIDYWDVKVVNEDSRQFWRAYFKFAGDHQVVPIYLPVYMDAVMSENLKETLKAQYQQRLRWAYGVEHFPYVFTECLKRKDIPFLDRLIKVHRLFEANFTWATASIFIPIVGWLPIILNHEFSNTVLAHNIPFYASRLLTVSWIGLILSALLSLRLMPPRPPKYRHRKMISIVLQWLLVPFTAIIYGSIPSIDAQTRLMLGRYMGYKTTKKVRAQD